MATALLSDLHANREALEACLAHARQEGVSDYVFLGDYVGYGADPVAVVERVAEYVAEGAIAVRGNHDEAIEHASGYFNEAALATLAWARSELGPAAKAFLEGLPLIRRHGELCWVHASAASPERWAYVDSPSAALHCVEAAEATYTFCGHVHDQALYFETVAGRMQAFVPTPGQPIPVSEHHRWLAAVGSVGQPRDSDPAAAYAVFDHERRQLTFHRVRYDAKAAADRIRACGLPESLAYRVELGI